MRVPNAANKPIWRARRLILGKFAGQDRDKNDVVDAQHDL
jgi:hypothetical protein